VIPKDLFGVLELCKEATARRSWFKALVSHGCIGNADDVALISRVLLDRFLKFLVHFVGLIEAVFTIP